MEVTRQYAGQSGSRETGIGFAPDLNRDPTWFVGTLGNTVAFREAMSVLHYVVTHDLRPKQPDRSAYFAWLESHKDQLLAEAKISKATLQDERKRISAELAEMRKIESQALKPYRDAENRYFKWLYKHDRAAWIILDPIIAVHPDEVSFECFSIDEACYGRLSVDLDMFNTISESRIGVTNIDYSQQLYDGFQQLRSRKQTELKIEPDGFTATTEGGRELREDKIDLPDSWVRGLLQVSSAMTMPLKRVHLHPMDMHNICATLRKRTEKQGPRSMRLRMKPGAPAEFVFEPWNEVLHCPRSFCETGEAEDIRIWGRRRFRILERLIPIAKRFDLYVMGSGMPCFVVADLGPMTFTLGLSGWTANDWSGAGRFDLLAPRRRVPGDLSRRVLEHLKTQWVGSADDIARAVGMSSEDASSALTALAQAGRVMFDLDKGFWRLRELFQEPLKLADMRFSSELEQVADQCVAAGLVDLEKMGPIEFKGMVTENGREHSVSVGLDGDERIASGDCSCWHFQSNALRKGPCAHMLALRRAAEIRKYDTSIATMEATQ